MFVEPEMHYAKPVALDHPLSTVVTVYAQMVYTEAFRLESPSLEQLPTMQMINGDVGDEYSLRTYPLAEGEEPGTPSWNYAIKDTGFSGAIQRLNPKCLPNTPTAIQHALWYGNHHESFEQLKKDFYKTEAKVREFMGKDKPIVPVVHLSMEVDSYCMPLKGEKEEFLGGVLTDVIFQLRDMHWVVHKCGHSYPTYSLHAVRKQTKLVTKRAPLWRSYVVKTEPKPSSEPEKTLPNPAATNVALSK